MRAPIIKAKWLLRSKKSNSLPKQATDHCFPASNARGASALILGNDFCHSARDKLPAHLTLRENGGASNAGCDIILAKPKVRAVQPLPQHRRERAHQRTAQQDVMRLCKGLDVIQRYAHGGKRAIHQSYRPIRALLASMDNILQAAHGRRRFPGATQ